MPESRKLEADALKTRRLEAQRRLDDRGVQTDAVITISRQLVIRGARLRPRQLAKGWRQRRKSRFDDAKRSKLRPTLLAVPLARVPQFKKTEY